VKATKGNVYYRDSLKRNIRVAASVLGILTLAAFSIVAAPAWAAPAPPVKSLSIQINDSPWLPAFEADAKLYQKETGIELKLNVTPFSGMLQKSRNAVQAPESEFDLINLNESWYMSFYANGWVTPLKEIDPGFKLDPEIIEYEWGNRWDPKVRYSTKNGEILGMPINGNIALFYYRTDVFREKGLQVPQSWDEVEQVAKALHSPPRVYGWANRTNPAWWELQAWMYGYGGGLLKLDEGTGEWTITISSDASVTALKRWLAFGKLYGPPNQNDISQADLIALMSSGKIAMGPLADSGARTLRDPQKSTVVGKIAATPFIGPKKDQRATISGIWIMGIPSNLPAARKQAGLQFLNWLTSKRVQLVHAKEGGSPVRKDVYQELANDPDVGWLMKAMVDSVPYIRGNPRFAETPQLMEILERHTGDALLGKASPENAMKEVANEVYRVLSKANYKVKPLN
jgi:multiple sugar transport system substrate-binding protein